MKKLLHTLIFVSFHFFAFANDTDTTFYSVVSSGSVTGIQKTWTTTGNVYHFIFRYNDRGRGVDLQTSVTLNKNGAVTKYSNEGLDYDKNPYHENLQTAGDSSIWMINSLKHAALTGKRFYTGNLQNMPPAVNELLIKWLQQQPALKGDVLPAGGVRLGLPITKKIAINGKEIVLKLYSIYRDKNPSPDFIWLDNEGRFFAQVDSWFSTIKRGYESFTDTLDNIQVQQRAGMYRKQMLKYAEKLPVNIFITHVNVFQSATAEVKNDQTVQVVNGKISAIYPSSQQPSNLKGMIIDGHGKFLMPGLWDMHSHYFPDDGMWYLAGGVTHIRDMGNSNIILTYKKQIQKNMMPGPDISYLSGFIDQKGPWQGPTGKVVATQAEAIQAIRDFHRLGYQQIKIYSSIDTGWVRPMCQEAHRLGMRICGHVPAFMSAEQAIKDGYDEITHINFVFLDFMDHGIDTKTPLRLRAVAEQGGNIDIKSSAFASFINLMKTKNIAFDPTLNVFSEELDDFKGDTVGAFKSIMAWAPESAKDDLVVSAPYGNADQEPAYRKSYSAMLKVVKMMYDQGIRIVPGTDGGNAFALQRELEIYVKAGIPAAQVLKIATWNTAADCGLSEKYGQIKTGRMADFILIDGDPVKNISDIRRVKMVFKNNRIYYPKKLLASQGWKYYY